MDDKEFMQRLFKYLRSNLSDLYWGIYGSTVKNPKLPTAPKSILFVCKGNICRSPFAEQVAIKLAKEKGFEQLTFHSAGLDVSKSVPPPTEAMVTSQTFGVQLDGHRSRNMTPDMVGLVDMVIVMEVRHFRTLRKSYPQFADKIFLLPLFEQNGRPQKGGFRSCSIPDPYGKPMDQFQSCFQRIEQCLVGLISLMRPVK